jgi:hypothetical protein
MGTLAWMEKQIEALKQENEALKKQLADRDEKQFNQKKKTDDNDDSSDDDDTEIQPIPEGGCQKVRGQYHQEYTWIIPNGIDLHDEETYNFSDRCAVLTIINKKTGEEWELHEPTYCDDDHKYTKELEVVNYDAKGHEIF